MTNSSLAEPRHALHPLCRIAAMVNPCRITDRCTVSTTCLSSTDWAG
ncbi:hypothetical protein [Maridesulfovibrio sp.]|nr:hypothetical protein [Maridesulfovibrio sp.]